MNNYLLEEPITILGVKSSRNDKIYTSVIWKDGLSCNCPCGGIGGFCKHLRNILDIKPEFLNEYTKENEKELKQKLISIREKVSNEVFDIIKEIEKIKKDDNCLYYETSKKERIKPYEKQIIRKSKHTISEAFKQAKLLDNQEVITTKEELKAFNIIKKIIKNNIEFNNISYYDYKNFFSIKIYNKTKCRLYLNGRQKSISFLKNGVEAHTAINDIDELYLHADLILQNFKEEDHG